METFPRFWSGKINKFRPLLEKCVSMYPWLLCIVNTISFIFSILMLNLAYWNKNSYRIRIKVRWSRDFILQKKFWKFIPYTCIRPCTPAQPPFCPLPHPCTPAHTHKSPRTPAHTHTRTQPCSPHTPHTYPLMPADALNLKNHMKLHVNGKMADDDRW